MAGITEILDMLDWHMSSEIQSKGRNLAKNIETIVPFIQCSVYTTINPPT